MRKVTSIRWIGLSLLLVLAAIVFWPAGSGTVFAQPPDEAPVTFPDPNLEATIREVLNKPEGAIYASELESITILEWSQRKITDLTGLEYCTNLQELRLWATKISDISPLSSLKSLTNLNLSHNQIRDISPLGGLTNLRRLELGLNQVSDISALSGLTNLRQLSLNSNPISDISPLSSLKNLTSLNLSGNPISDISALSRLTNLEHLSLSLYQISDISPLSSLKNLTTLNLSTNQIRDISPLGGLTNLRQLFLGANQVSDISALSRLTNLEQLSISRSQISDISPLSGLKSLTNLNLSNNQIRDISALSGLTNLRSLGLNYNQISDISPLGGLSALLVVELERNPLSTASLEIYIPLLRIKGVSVRPFPKPVILRIIMYAALALVAIGILITMGRVRSWGVSRRVLQLAVIIIPSGLAFYVTAAVYRHYSDDFLLVSFLASILVGFGTVITFWSFRGKPWDLLGWLLIVLAVLAVGSPVGVASAPGLGTAGTLFILRRKRPDIQFIVSVIVCLVFSLITVFAIGLMRMPF